MKHSDSVKWLCLFSVLLLSLFIAPQSAFSQYQPFQRIEVPSSMNPVGSGARALGMGGAFIAVADDATAASWNPAGLIQLETPEVSIVGAYFTRSEDIDFGTNPEASGNQNVENSNINYLSTAYPFSLFERNMIISANYQYLYELNRDWEFPLTTTGPGLVMNQDITIEQKGSLSAIGIAYAVQMTPRVSFGFTLNFWETGFSGNKWENEIRQSALGTYAGYDYNFKSDVTDEYSFQGFNANLGALWTISSRLSLGFVLKTPFTADLEHCYEWSSETRYPEAPAANTSDSSSGEEDEDLDMPMSYGIGLAYRSSDKLTTSLDIYRTEWNDYILTDSDGNKISPITGSPADESDVEPTLQIRAGMEYLYIKDTYVIPFRGGVFYDPVPADGKPDDFYGFSLGTGVARGNFVFDLAYQCRLGNNASTFILESFDPSQDVQENTLYTSLIFHF